MLFLCNIRIAHLCIHQDTIKSLCHEAKVHHMTASAYKKQATLSKASSLHKKGLLAPLMANRYTLTLKKVHSIFANFVTITKRGSQLSWVITKGNKQCAIPINQKSMSTGQKKKFLEIRLLALTFAFCI